MFFLAHAIFMCTLMINIGRGVQNYHFTFFVRKVRLFLSVEKLTLQKNNLITKNTANL